MAKDGRKVAVVIGVGTVIAGLIFVATRAKAAPSLDITVSPTSFPTRGEKPSSTPITVIITNTSNSPIWRVELLPVPAEGTIIASIPWKTTNEWETEQTGEVEQVEGWTRYVTMGLRMVAKEGYAIQPGETRSISVGVLGAEVSSGTQWIIECENTVGKMFTNSVIMTTI